MAARAAAAEFSAVAEAYSTFSARSDAIAGGFRESIDFPAVAADAAAAVVGVLKQLASAQLAVVAARQVALTYE
mgnify:CR=1 FL=1